MAKGLPYFKFIATEWLTGDISFEDFEIQGLFIQICALYWQRNGNLSVEDIMKRYKKPNAFNSLSGRFISVNDGLINIAFLDEQLSERLIKSRVNSLNGKKGGRPKSLDTIEQKSERLPNANRNKSERKAKKSNIEEEKEEEKNIKLSKPKKVSFENSELHDKHKFAETFSQWSKSKLAYYYEAALSYSIEGNKYVDWAKAINNWAKRDELAGKLKFTEKQELTQEELNKIKEREFYARL